MTEKWRALFKYENETKLVETIDLQLCISLKLDGMYKKGASWYGPRREHYFIIHKYSHLLHREFKIFH